MGGVLLNVGRLGLYSGVVVGGFGGVTAFLSGV